MDNFPPPGFVPAESKLEGVSVFKPLELVEEHKEVISFRCPQCDGETAFNAADGGITCTYCGHHEKPEQEVIGLKAERFEFTVETIEQASHGWGTERKEIVCQSCTSHIVVEPDALTTSCPFCNSNKVVQHKAPQDVLQPRFLVPFKVDDEACHDSVREWLGSNWLVPQKLKQFASVGEFTPMFLPYWTFDSKATASWKAQVAHTRTVRRNGKTTTQTVWRWESGNVNNDYRNVKVKGSDRLSKVLLKKVQSYDLNEMTAYNPQFLAGSQALAYESGLEDSWAAARHAMREMTRNACRSQASSSRMRNFSMQLDFSDEAWRYILLPVYIATYNYNNQPFQLLVNGQTGAVGGQRPADWRKIALVSLIPMLIGAAIMLWQWFVQISDSQVPTTVAGILFLLGVILAIVLSVLGMRLDDA